MLSLRPTALLVREMRRLNTEIAATSRNTLLRRLLERRHEEIIVELVRRAAVGLPDDITSR